MQSQEVKIKPNVNVVLKSDAEQLDEVMVVAYGTAKKSSFTGAAASVDGAKALKDIPVTSFERKHSKKCTFYTLRFGCSFAAVNTIKPQLLWTDKNLKN